ncbi:hypothetical protein R3P38DRAFT_2815033 [Favolaschia claudopus]|uniref:Uncharacterized protein n=1 Tax=Favolaschia claudopus TaxID=2862362 RepID=A0AAV9Z275_9AGAR
MASVNVSDPLTTAVESYLLSSVSSETDIFPFNLSTWARVRNPAAGIDENLEKSGQGLLLAAFNLTCTAEIGGLSAECPLGMHAALRNCIVSDRIIAKIFQKIRFKNLQLNVEKSPGVKLPGIREQFAMLIAGIWIQTTSFSAVCDWVNEVFGPVIGVAIVEYRKSCPSKQASAPKELVLLQRIHDFQVAKASLQRADIDPQIGEVSPTVSNSAQNSPVLAPKHAEASFGLRPPLILKTLAPTPTDEVASNVALSGLLPPLVLKTSTLSSSALIASNVTPPPVGDNIKAVSAPFEDVVNDRAPTVDRALPLAEAAAKDQSLPVEAAAEDPSPVSPPAQAAVKDSLLSASLSFKDGLSEFEATVKDRWPTPLRRDAPPPHVPSPLRSPRNSHLQSGFHPHSLLSYRQTSPQSCDSSSTSSATAAPSSPLFCIEDYLRMSPRSPYLPVGSPAFTRRDESASLQPQPSNVKTFSQWLKSSPL